MNSIIYSDLENVRMRDIPWEQLKNTSVMVTGAYGMLASYVMYMLIYLNDKYDYNITIIPVVRSIDKFKYYFAEYADKKYINVLVHSLDTPINYQGRIDYIFHAASFASPQYYSVCPVDVSKPNVIGTYYLLELARQKKIKGFLMFSTGDIYGPIFNEESVKEESMGAINPLDIHSCYGESKRMAETFCSSYWHQYGVPTKIARIWHTYSPTMKLENDPRVFCSFVNNMVHHENIVMKSEGKQRRSFCYIADALAAFFQIVFLGAPGEAYNVCNTNEYVSIAELAEILINLRKDQKLSVIRKERQVNDTYLENNSIGNIPPNNDKLRALGWKPQYSLVEGFNRVLEYYGL